MDDDFLKEIKDFCSKARGLFHKISNEEHKKNLLNERLVVIENYYQFLTGVGELPLECSAIQTKIMQGFEAIQASLTELDTELDNPVNSSELSAIKERFTQTSCEWNVLSGIIYTFYPDSLLLSTKTMRDQTLTPLWNRINDRLKATSPALLRSEISPTIKTLVEMDVWKEAQRIVHQVLEIKNRLDNGQNNLNQIRDAQNQIHPLSNKIYDINFDIKKNPQLSDSDKQTMQTCYDQVSSIVNDLAKLQEQAQKKQDAEQTHLATQQLQQRRSDLENVARFLDRLTKKRDQLFSNSSKSLAYNQMNDLITKLNEFGSRYEENGDFKAYQGAITDTINTAKQDLILTQHRGWGDVLAIFRSIVMAVITLGYSMKRCYSETGNAFFSPAKTDSINQIEKAQEDFNRDIGKMLK